MPDPSRWNVREVIECESGTVQREVWYREHDETWCHRYTVRKSPMLSRMFSGVAPAHDEMLGLIAARTYYANEIITIYTGEDIGAVDGMLDAHKGYHRIAALAEGDDMNKGRHVMEVLKYMNDDDEASESGPRRMWRRLIDGYSGYTCAQYSNAAYRAPRGFYDKARLCEGGTIRVKMGCVIHAGRKYYLRMGRHIGIVGGMTIRSNHRRRGGQRGAQAAAARWTWSSGQRAAQAAATAVGWTRSRTRRRGWRGRGVAQRMCGRETVERKGMERTSKEGQRPETSSADGAGAAPSTSS